MSKRAAIYCRVSTREQAEEGNSLTSQEQHCREYALKHGYEIVEAFIEHGESAKTTQRKELQRLLDYCSQRSNHITAVIAYKIDRISRNTDDYSYIRILLKRYGVEIRSTSENFENSTPAGKFMENMIATVAQFDNDVRAERCMGGMRDACREGRYVWGAPIGYTNGKIGEKSTILPNELAPLVKKSFELVASNNLPTEEIRRSLNKEGLNLTKSSFYRMLRNELYSGQFLKFGERFYGKYEALITPQMFNQVQRVLKYRTRRNCQYERENPDFPLRRFIKHESGLSLTGYWAKGRTKRYAYYRFHLKGYDFKKAELEERFKEFLNQYRLSESLCTKLKKFVVEQLVKATRDQTQTISNWEKAIANLNEEIRELSKNKAAGLINEFVFDQQVKLIEKDLFHAHTVLARLPRQKDADFERLFEFVHRYLKDPVNVWQNASFALKLKLQWFYFPTGILFDGFNCRTAETCFLFKLKGSFLADLSRGVDSRILSSKIPNQMGVMPGISVEKEKVLLSIRDEIISLAEIASQSEQSSQPNLPNSC